ncbi:MAG: hypothetical protein Fur0024_5030 [Patescibacteria group bacterium]
MKGKYLLGTMLVMAMVYGSMPQAKVSAADNDTHNVVFTVGNTIEVEVVDGSEYVASMPTMAEVSDDDTTVKTIDFGTNLSFAASPYEILSESGVAVRVRTNPGYTHTLAVKSADWTGPVGHTKPLSDLKLKGADFDAGFNTYTALTTTDQIVKAAGTVDGTGSAKYYKADYQLTVNASDLVGSYSTTVTYTAS